ncbi:hypothetical protein C0Q70_21297 [Pomacea canaliculata]|uniref:Uncharacterized protein n=1 Tax=Pomacea canaliculata TaxID=400727 RepID=A0A2T7NC39_POMCA|nr:hypothetical protein C0Q70_21297 [Pomacea canaliculata]
MNMNNKAQHIDPHPFLNMWRDEEADFFLAASILGKVFISQVARPSLRNSVFREDAKSELKVTDIFVPIGAPREPYRLT